MYMAVNTLHAKEGKELVDTLNNFQHCKENCAVGSYKESFCAFLCVSLQIVLTIWTDFLRKISNNCFMFQNF